MKKISLLLVFVMLLATLFAVSVFAKTITSNDVASATTVGGNGAIDPAVVMFDGVTEGEGLYAGYSTKDWYNKNGTTGEELLTIELKQPVTLTGLKYYAMGNYLTCTVKAYNSEGEEVFTNGTTVQSTESYTEYAILSDANYENVTKITVGFSANKIFRLSEVSIEYHECSFDTLQSTTTEATCGQAGVGVYACECGKTQEGEILATGEHDWLFTGYDENNVPICYMEVEGLANYVCLVCEETKQESALHRFTYFAGHVEGEEPTCTEYGYSTFECLYCTASETRKVAPQHSYEKDAVNSVTPTCTAGGKDVYVCSACDDSYTEEVPANGHNFNYWYGYTTTVEPTCTEEGENLYTCYNCGATETGKAEATGHNWVDGEIDTTTHTVVQTCSNGCGNTQTVSTLGMEVDPIVIEVPGSFTASVTGSWTYYTFDHVEGYITFTFDTDNVNAMVKDTTETYTSQFFWGGSTEWKAELMESGSYVVAISSNDGAAIDIAVTTTMEETDVPDLGEVAEKPIVIEGVNTAYTSTGKVWYTFQTPTAGTVTINVEGTATVSYGTDATALVTYTEAFVDEYGWTTYYILVESEAEATIVVNVEAPKGSQNNPLELVVGNNEGSYAGGWQPFYTTYYAASNGSLTLTFDGLAVYMGTHPYQMQTSVTSGEAITVEAGYTYWIGVSTAEQTAVDFNIAVAFEGEAVEAPEPETEIGDKIGSMDVKTTDTYGYFDMYTYTAENAGQYTFFVPVGLGFYSKTLYDTYGNAEIDLYDAVGGYVAVNLEAGEAYTFYVGAETKDTWTIDVYYYVEEVEIPEKELVIGDNETSENVKYTYTAEANGTLTLDVDVDGAKVTYSVNGADAIELTETTEIKLVKDDVIVINVTVESEDPYVAVTAAWTEESSHECAFNNLTSVVYADGFLKDGVATYACECGETNENVAPAIFVYLGHSIKDDGSAMCVGYTVNREALVAYETANETTVKFGLVNAGYDNLVNANGKPVNADGTAAEVSKGSVAMLALEDTVYTSFAMKMTSTNWAPIAEAKVILCAYVIEGENVSYICGNTASDSASYVTYNSLTQEV